MSIAVIIVNYGTADHAIDAADSVLKKTLSRDVEVHLVDNASQGNDVEKLRATIAERNWGDRVTLWPETINHGFGEGNNVVLRSLAARDVKPEFVFLLNPDATLQNDVVDQLATALEADPKAAAAGAGLLDSTGRQTTAAFRFPGMISELDHATNFGPLARMLRRFRVALPPDFPAGPVDWVSGAAVMFRLAALETVDFFDPRFFLYYEEVDLMRRLRAAGWRNLYTPSALVLHHEGVSTGVKTENLVRRRNPPYLYHSWRVYFSKSIGWGKTLILALLLLPAAAANLIQLRLRGRRSHLPISFFSDHWRYVIWPLITRERKP